MLTFKKLSELKPESKKSPATPTLASLDGQTIFLTGATIAKPWNVQVYLTATAEGHSLYTSGKRVNEQILVALVKGECDAIEVKVVKGKRGVTLE